MSRTQQLTLYAAERQAQTGPTFTSLEELDRWLHTEILDREWFHERYPKVRAVAVHKASRRDGSVGAWFPDDWSGQIEMSPDHWCAKYVCHELAHVIAKSTDGEGHGHDPVFCQIYLGLVFLTLGSEAWMDLRQRLLDAGVVIDPRDDV